MIAGRYLIVAHYYQPKYRSFTPRAGVYSGTSGGLPGSIEFRYCPNLNGCRSPIQRRANEVSYYAFEEGDARIRFDLLEGQEAWIVSFGYRYFYSLYNTFTPLIFAHH